MSATGVRSRALGVLRGSHTIPRTPWTAASRWEVHPTTLAILVVGLALFGFGQALQVQAGLGNGPWTVFAQGLSLRAGTDLGTAYLITGCAVLLVWVPFRERPGLGTLANIVVISATLEAGVRLVPAPHDVAPQLALWLAGTALIGLGSALYLTCGLGPGPRDGWMTAAHARSGWPVARVRLLIEVTVLAVGWALGGTVGIGTLLFALLIGRSVASGMALVTPAAPKS